MAKKAGSCHIDMAGGTHSSWRGEYLAQELSIETVDTQYMLIK